MCAFRVFDPSPLLFLDRTDFLTRRLPFWLLEFPSYYYLDIFSAVHY
jgi:hypothetical protein